jgi:hypothetical protein
MARTIRLLMTLGLGACAANPEPVPQQPMTGAPSASAEPSAPSTPSGAKASPPALPPLSPSSPAEVGGIDPPPDEIEYPFRGLATIPDDWKEPSVVLTTAPTKMGWDYDWTWTRQALYANPQFPIVDWPAKPEKPMQVRLDMYEIPGGFALVGVCRDGATCNKLAAMYKSTVPTCNPRLHCGTMPVKGTPRQSRIIPADGQWLPLGDANIIGRCARIGVCLNVKHERMSHNPGVDCQSAPARFRAECAKKPTCDEVVQCLR